MSCSKWARASFLHTGLWLFLGAMPGMLYGQVFHGRLIDDASERPIATAVVGLVDDDDATVSTALTDSAGRFLVEGSAAGEYRLTAERIGYPATISTGLRVAATDTLEVEFRISASAVLLDPVVVTSRRRRRSPLIADFYERAERSISGTFITRAEVERVHPLRTTDLLRRIPGVQLVPLRYGGSSAVLMRGGCRPLIVVDGMALRDVRSIDDLMQPLELEGMEVYRSPSEVPVEYGGLRLGCGAILLWSRRG